MSYLKLSDRRVGLLINFNVKLGCLRQRLLSPPQEGGAGGVLWQTYTPLYPIRVKLSVSWGGMDKLCLSLPRNQQRYESYRRCGRSLSPAGGGRGGVDWHK